MNEKEKEKIYIKKGKRFKKLGLFRKAGFRFIILKVIQSLHKASRLCLRQEQFQDVEAGFPLLWWQEECVFQETAAISKYSHISYK
jgi:hypothetical protein